MRPLRAFAAIALVLLPLLGGCEDEKKPPPAWALPAAAAAVKAAPIEQIEPPPSVIAWGGADNPEKLAAAESAFVAQLSPLVPSVLDVVKDQLRARMSLTRLDGIDWARPARVAVFDPKGMPKAELVVVLTLANKAAFLATLPAANKKENDEGNAITYRDDLGRSICLSFVDDQVIVTWEKKQFSQNAEFLVKLARATVPDQQAFLVSAKNMGVLYAKDIDDQIAQAKQQAVNSPWAALGVPPEASAMGLSWMVSAFKDMDTVEALPKFVEDGALLSLRFRPKAGSDVEKSFKGMEARPHALFTKLPPDAPMFASFSTNPDVADGFAPRLLERVLYLSLSVPVPEGSFPITGGEIVFGVHKPVGGDGLTMTTLFATRDEAKQRAGLRGLFAPFKEKEMIDKYKKSGIVIDYKENAFKVGAVAVDEFDRKEDKGTDLFSMFGPLGDSMREFSSRETAVSKDFGVIGQGKDARKTIEAFLSGKVTGGLDKAAGPARALRLGVPNPVGIVYVSPVEIAKRASVNGKNPLADSFKDLASTTGVGLSFAAKDGELTLVLDVPVEQARNIAQALTRAQAILPH
jgi:hypothetical protein